ncbi:toxin-antitoxin system HicB family antitoxin [Pseudokineococcus sp. 1T1Z-3]|uniref:toxin-antitoxin system HicB family antitoxin n=1 Tax=Pseudokineococcus sp. 1T1Z-3 TaxID=3132745 RepID=UPI0030AFD2F5
MSQPRPRPRTGQSVAVYARVHPDLHAKAHRAAAALDVSLATYVEALLARDELDESGRPTWWPRDEHAQEDLLRQTA